MISYACHYNLGKAIAHWKATRITWKAFSLASINKERDPFFYRLLFFFTGLALCAKEAECIEKIAELLVCYVDYLFILTSTFLRTKASQRSSQ